MAEKRGEKRREERREEREERIEERERGAEELVWLGFHSPLLQSVIA